MILKPSPISSDNFSFRNLTFTAESSELPRSFNLGRVYDDACDEGFTIVSERTGRSAVFALEKSIMDPSGEDVLGWEFVCVTPNLRNLKTVIYND